MDKTLNQPKPSYGLAIQESGKTVKTKRSEDHVCQNVCPYLLSNFQVRIHRCVIVFALHNCLSLFKTKSVIYVNVYFTSNITLSVYQYNHILYASCKGKKQKFMQFLLLGLDIACII